MCSLCTTGSYHLCESGGINSTIGIFTNGGWAQFCKVPAKQVYRVPDEMPLQRGMTNVYITLYFKCMPHLILKLFVSVNTGGQELYFMFNIMLSSCVDR